MGQPPWGGGQPFGVAHREIVETPFGIIETQKQGGSQLRTISIGRKRSGAVFQFGVMRLGPMERVHRAAKPFRRFNATNRSRRGGIFDCCVAVRPGGYGGLRSRHLAARDESPQTSSSRYADPTDPNPGKYLGR
jgi:hypothetical protein